MANFWERAAHSVDLILLCVFVIYVISRFGFDGGTVVLNAEVPGNCLPLCLLRCYVIVIY